MSIPENRAAGILLHITSLPNDLGIGDMGPGAYHFVDKLAKTGARYWQMLPLGPTGYGNSPYSERSTFAGNELLISLELLVRDGLLRAEEIERHPVFLEDHVDYSKVQSWKIPLLKKAAKRALESDAFRMRLAKFRSLNAYWLEDYSLFMVLYEKYSDARWYSVWSKEEGRHSVQVLESLKKERGADVEIWQALQLMFDEQCKALGTYANERGILTIGDIPIFVGMDSADVWSDLRLFKTDPEGNISDISGVPPDNFSATGQLWGTPVYDWDYHYKTGFQWWINRVRRCLELNDIIRIDHFRGFESYYNIPAGSDTAEHGEWISAPGTELFESIHEELGELSIIAEDLGNITDSVRKLRLDNGFPGMKIAQFGFNLDGRGELDLADEFLPCNYKADYVAYLGTHDNDTTLGWFNSISGKEQQAVLSYLNTEASHVVDSLMTEVLKSRAGTVVLTMQDVLGLDGRARMNYPSTCNETNWSWRMTRKEFESPWDEKLAKLVSLR